MNIYKCIAKEIYMEKYNNYWEDCINLVVAETRGRAKSLAHSDAKKNGGLAYYGGFTDWRATLEAKNVNHKEGIPEENSPIWWVGITLGDIMQMFLQDLFYGGSWWEEHALEDLDKHLNVLNRLEMITGKHYK